MKKLLLGLLLAVAPLPASAAQVLILQTPVSQTTASPTISGAGDTVAYVAGGASIVLENGLIVSCTCAQLDSATVTISAGTFTGDTLSAAVTAGLTAVYSSPTLTLSGTANVSAYVQALQSVTFSSSNADPTNSGSNLTRTVTWTANNGAHASNQPTTTINVSTPTSAPTLANAGSTDTFTSGGSPTVIEPGITTACSCSNLTGATVTISNGLLALDTLAATTVGSITAAYDSSAGILTLSGTDTKANYQTVLQSVTYSSGLADPTNGGADTSRAISWVASNGASNSAAVTSTIITQNPAVPTIVVAAGNSISYTSGGVGIAVDNALSVSCTCANLSGATLTLSSGFFNGDILAVSTAFGITPVYNSVTGVMNLSGTSTVANYQTLLRTILYSSSAGDPSNGGHNATRTATWVASNGANVSFPATTTINVFLTGQPTWAMTGAVVALNPSINQAWVSGTGTGPLSSQITVTRSTQETCYTGVVPVAVTYAAANVACATGSGLAIWPAYTNYMQTSLDISASPWITYCGAACPNGGSTVTVTGNSVLDPTGATSQAAKVAVVRTSTGNFAIVAENSMNAPAGTYSGSIWLKADAGGDVGTVIQFAFLSNSGYIVHNVTLTANWQNVTFASMGAPVTGCVGASQTCQFQVGLTNQPGSGTANSTLAANFDIWGAEMNGGTYVYPVLPTALAPVVTAADNIAVSSGSALETALKGAASSVIMNSTLGVQSKAVPLLDSNGTTWLGEGGTNFLTTAIGTPVSTTNTGLWNSPNVFGIARDVSGRTMALNGSVIVKDTVATSIGTPLFLGSTSGTSNYFNGYLGTLNAFNVRVADSLLGVTGAGTSYYFANNSTCLAIAAGTNGSCSDTNACTLLQTCNTITKANSIGIVTNDHIFFNGGDTFTGCLTFQGGVNWNATRAQPATVTSFGTGQGIISSNCSATNGSTGIIRIISADGVNIQNLELFGDGVGNASDGIRLINCDTVHNHGTNVIQGNTFTNIVMGASAIATANAGAAIFIDASCNGNFGGNKPQDHISIINNTEMGQAGDTSHDTNFLDGFGVTCQVQFDAIQGNLIFNVGGQITGTGGQNFDANGILVPSACGVGSTLGTPSGALTNVQFNVVHDIGHNIAGKCGSFYPIWASASDSIVFRLNEVYNNHPVLTGPASCDSGGFDLDIGGNPARGTGHSIVERNYSHNNYGPCMLEFQGVSGQSNTFRWNICDVDSYHNGGLFSSSGTSLVYVYNNTLVGGAWPASNFAVQMNGCLASGSMFANNIVVNTSSASGTNSLMNLQQTNTIGTCLPLPTGGLIFANNDWFGQHTSNFRCWRNGQGNPPDGVTGTYTQCAAVVGETGGITSNPTFQGTIGLNVTCNSAVGSTGPQPCPAAYKLAGGSPNLSPAGAVLTSQPYNLPIGNTNGQGTVDYYGVTLPCAGGFPIGASC